MSQFIPSHAAAFMRALSLHTSNAASRQSPTACSELYCVENLSKSSRRAYWAPPKFSLLDVTDENSDIDDGLAYYFERADRVKDDYIHIRCASRSHPDISWRISARTDDINSQGIPSNVTIAALYDQVYQNSKQQHIIWTSCRISEPDSSGERRSSRAEILLVESKIKAKMKQVKSCILSKDDTTTTLFWEDRPLRDDQISLTTVQREGFDQEMGFTPHWDTVLHAFKAEKLRRNYGLSVAR